MMNAGTISHAAIAAWMQDSLSRRYDTVLREPVPQALLAILDMRTEANAASRPVQGQSRRTGF